MADESENKKSGMAPATRSNILVVGVGGAGSNVLDRISLDGGITNADLLTMNTDVRALNSAVTTQRIQLGADITHGLGTGGDPDVGRATAIEAEEEIRQVVSGREMVFVCCGLGGGTGSGAAPIVAQLAREEGAFVCVFANMPFEFEGRRRVQQAEQAMELLRHHANALIAFENDRIGELILNKQGIQEAFVAADQTISHSIVAIINLVRQPGMIRIGMDDVLTALRNTDSRCIFGLGTAKGENRAQESLKRALHCPLLDRGKMLQTASNLIVHITGGESLTLFEVENLMRELNKNVHPDAHTLFGASVDKEMGEQMSVTIISSLSKGDLISDDDGDTSDTGRKSLGNINDTDDSKKKTSNEIASNASSYPFVAADKKKSEISDDLDDSEENTETGAPDFDNSNQRSSDSDETEIDAEQESDTDDEETSAPVKKEPSSAAARIGHTVIPSSGRHRKKDKKKSLFFRSSSPEPEDDAAEDEPTEAEEQNLLDIDNNDLDYPTFLREKKGSKK